MTDQRTKPPFLVRPIMAAILLGVAATIFFCTHLYFMSEVYGGDWRYFHFINEAIRTSIGEFGQLPLWNPWACGGYPLHANPQSAAISPLTPLMLIFGTNAGMKLYVWMHLLAGMLGAYFLGRTLAFKHAGLYLLPLSFVTSAWFAWHIQGGQMTMVTLLLLPWVFGCYLRSKQDWRYLIGGAAALGLMFLEGGTYGIPMTFVFMGVFVAVDFFANDYDYKAVVRLGLIVLGGVCIGAVKVLPIIDLISYHPRPMGHSDDKILFPLLVKIFFSRRTDIWVHKETDGDLIYRWWGEYGSYIGPILTALVLLAIAVRYRTYKRWIWLMVFFGLIMVGNHGSYMPWEVLKQLPVYKDLRVPTRYALLVVLCIGILAASMLEEIVHWLKTRGRPWLATGLGVLLTLVVAADLVSYGVQILSKMKHEPVKPVDVRKEFRQERGHAGQMERFVRANAGSVGCYEAEWISPAKALRFNLTNEAWPLSPRTATARRTVWSPNRIELRVDATADATIVYNMNADKWWRTSVGDIGAHQGLLAVSLPAGTHDVVLTYEPRPFYIGGVVTACSLLACIGVLLWAHRRRKPSS